MPANRDNASRPSSSSSSSSSSSPFFHPHTPRAVVVVRRSPGGRTVRKVALSEEDSVREHKSGIVGCASNLVNAIVGSGIVGVPYALKQSGFAAGVALVVLCAVITEKSLRLLVFTSKHVHTPSYETVAEAAFGIWGFRFVAVSMFFFAYGAMVGYLIVVKDSFSTILGFDENQAAVRRAVLAAVSLAVIVPLSCQRDMADLAVTSRLSVLIDCVIVGVVACNSPVHTGLDAAGGLWTVARHHALELQTVFIGLGVLSYAFVCQHSAFIIAGSLRRPTVARWSTVTAAALSFCSVLAMIIGVAGYLAYLDDTAGNVLQNFSAQSVAGNAARAGLGVTMLFVYPMESFVARHVCVVLLFQGRRAHEGDDTAVLNRRDRRIALTAGLYVLAVVPAAFCNDLGAVLAVTGATAGSCLSYIGPGAIYLGIHGGRFLELVEQSCLFTSRRKRRQQQQQPRDNNDNVKATDTDKDKKKGTTTTTGAAAAAKTEPVEHEEPPTVYVETTPLVSEAEKIGKETRQKRTGNDDDDNDNDDDDAKPAPNESSLLLDDSSSSDDECFLIAFARSIVWYVTLMPVWCGVARAGRRNLTDHVHDMALKSPHPIRIGDVEYERVPVSMRGQIQLDPADARAAAVLNTSSSALSSSPLSSPKLSRKPPARSDSLPLRFTRTDSHVSVSEVVAPSSAVSVASTALATSSATASASSTTGPSSSKTPPPSFGGGFGARVGSERSVNQQIGKELLKLGRQRQKEAALEPDPQHDPPGWMDFAVAIFFVVFGLVALCAGLVSLYCDG